tara:strand:+ start:1278 stop:1436 length:159 start_codon:yes stop_codon:yes gene_type:complete
MDDNQKKAQQWLMKEMFFDIDAMALRSAIFDWAQNECSCYECLVEQIKTEMK